MAKTSVPPRQAFMIGKRLHVFGRMIKFSHTIFALPFALAAVALACRGRMLPPSQLFWILVAMVGARSAAMGFNRIADAAFDAENPRTANREIPSGRISKPVAALFVLLFSGLFVLSAAMLSRLCLYLSLPVLALLFSYSYTKRFTWLCHIYLGAVISMAPLGAWIAVTGSLDWRIGLLSLALMTHIAAFDILYACQDLQFDQNRSLHSIPSRLGIGKAMTISAVLHGAAFLFLLGLYSAFDLSGFYLATTGIIGLLFLIEHILIKSGDMTHIHTAFFQINSWVSVILFLGILADILMGGP